MSDTPYPKDEKGRFLPGNIGGGRQKGSRNKLGEEFTDALYADFQQHGIEAIEQVRQHDPAAYVRVIANLLPKEMKVTTVQDLTDEQLDARIRHLAAALEIGVSDAPRGSRPKETAH